MPWIAAICRVLRSWSFPWLAVGPMRLARALASLSAWSFPFRSSGEREGERGREREIAILSFVHRLPIVPLFAPPPRDGSPPHPGFWRRPHIV